MPKLSVNSDAAVFGKRLVALLEKAGHPRRGAGAYLHKKYFVSSVVANAWLNGEYKPGIPVAEKIARDHGSTLDELYFNKRQASGWPFPFPEEDWALVSDEAKRIVFDAAAGAVRRAKEAAPRGRRASSMKS